MFVKTKIEKHGDPQFNKVYITIRYLEEKIYAVEDLGDGVTNYYEAPFTEENIQTISQLSKETAAEFVKENFESSVHFIQLESIGKDCNTINYRVIFLR